MNKLLFLFLACLFQNECLAQKNEQLKLIGNVHRVVYFVAIGIKKQDVDSSFSYHISDQFQLNSPRMLQRNEIISAIKDQVVHSNYVDSLFVDSSLLFLDYIQRNDSVSFNELNPIENKAVDIKLSSYVGKSFYDTVGGVEFTYSLSMVEGDWVELEITKDLAEEILGRTILLYKKESDKRRLFILTKQQKALPIIDL